MPFFFFTMRSLSASGSAFPSNNNIIIMQHDIRHAIEQNWKQHQQQQQRWGWQRLWCSIVVHRLSHTWLFRTWLPATTSTPGLYIYMPIQTLPNRIYIGHACMNNPIEFRTLLKRFVSLCYLYHTILYNHMYIFWQCRRWIRCYHINKGRAPSYGQSVLDASGHFQIVMRNRCTLFSIRSTNVFHEIWLVDIRRWSGT